MPDLVTHIVGAYLVNRGWRIARGAAFFYLGAMLPDLITRPVHILFPRLLHAVAGFHTPFAIFLVCWLISFFFRTDQRKPVFWLLFAGSLLHFLMDLAQKHLTGGYLWLFPFSSRQFSWGFIYPEDSITFLPLTLLLAGAVFAWDAWRHRKARKAG